MIKHYRVKPKNLAFNKALEIGLYLFGASVFLALRFSVLWGNISALLYLHFGAFVSTFSALSPPPPHPG